MKTSMVLTLVAAFFLLLVAGSTPAAADLGGSNVTFAPSVNGSMSCVNPTRNGTYCFSAESKTSDGEDAHTLFLRFPSTWYVYPTAPTVASTSCDNGGAFGATVLWTPIKVDNIDNIWELDQQRTQNGSESCTAVYCIKLAPDDSFGLPSVDWSWYSDDTVGHAAPHRPCSGQGWDDPRPGTCDATGLPAAALPVCSHEMLTVLPETIPAAEAGTYYTQQFTASDANGQVLGADQGWWLLLSDPDGLSQYCELDQSTGVLECHENTSPPVGTYNFTIYVEAFDGWTDGDREYTLVVNPHLTFDAVTLLGADEANEGELKSYSFTSSDPGGGPFSVVAESCGANGTLSNASFDPATGAGGFDCTFPDGPASSTVSVQVRDGAGAAADDSVEVAIANVAPQVQTVGVSPEPSIKGSPGVVSASFSDANPDDGPFSCLVNYGDGSESLPGTVAGTTCTGPAHAYIQEGAQSVSVTIADKDGATGTSSASHTVIYAFSGFFRPVDNQPVVNVANAGRSIPVKFGLGGDQGLNIFAPGFPTVKLEVCGSATSDTIETYGQGSGLTYDPLTQQYTYVWQTLKAWAGKCGRLQVKLVDGTLHEAAFRFN